MTKYRPIFLRSLITFILLLAIGIVLSRTVNQEEVVRLLQEFPKHILILVLILAVVIQFLKAVRFLFLLRQAGIRISFWQVLKISLAGQATSALPAGEMMRGFLLRKETDASYVKTSGPILLQILLELAVAVIFTAIGSVYFEELRIPAGIMLILLGGFFYLLYHKTLFQNLMAKIPNVKYIGKLADSFAAIQDKIQSTMMSSKKNIAQAYAKTIGVIAFTNIVGGFMIYLIAMSYDVHLDVFQSIFIFSSSIVLSAFGGISPGGLGVTESGMTGIFLLSNVDFAKAVVIVLIFRLATFIFSVLTGLLFLSIFYGKALLLNKDKKDE
jgi:uncharacterized protein (TIRG00374 family)